MAARTQLRSYASVEQPWHAAEPGLRWTDGDAGLALAGVRELVVELAMAGRYWVRQSGSVAAIRA